MKATYMTDTHVTKRGDTARVAQPAMPRLAAKAARDLVRPAKAISDALRALDAWFAQHGDPFSAMDAAAFAASFGRHRNVLDEAAAALSMPN
jgi:hypothetical protein